MVILNRGHITGKSILKAAADSLQSINPWHFLWISVVLSEILTFLLSWLQSALLWGRIPRKVMAVASVDALFVPVIIAPIVIYFVSKTREVERARDRLLKEVEERRKAELDLRREKVFTENALNALQETFFVFDPEGRFLRWNKTFRNVTGYGDEEISAMKAIDFFPEEERRRVAEAVSTAMSAGQAGLETVILTKDGRRIPFMCTGSLLKNIEGRIIGISGTGTDISARKLAESLLQESEAKFRDMAEKSLVGIYLIQDGIFRYVNPRLAEIFGYTVEELTDRKGPEDLVFGQDWPIVREKIRKRIAGELLSTHYSFRGIRGDKRIIHVEAYGSKTTFRESPAVIGTLLDITHRKRAEEALRESEGKYRNLIETAHDLIWSVNAEGGITFINEATRQLYGCGPEELIGWSFADVISSGHPEKAADFFRNLANDDGGVVNYETTVIGREGTPVVLSTNAVVLRDRQGNVLGTMGTSKDVTAYRQAEEALRASSSRLRSLTSELSLTEERERRKIAGELHDHIGQNLALAKIKIGEFRASLDSGDRMASLDFIRELIEQAIKYTRSLTSELGSPLLYEIGLEAAVQALAEHFQEKYGIRVAFRGACRGRPLSEETLVVLYKAVRELLVNIIKHARADNVTVSVEDAGAVTRVSVEDNGDGFDVSGIEDLGKDTKFGLFNIRERVESIGGRFMIESGEGSGTRAVLAVPAGGADQDQGK